MAELLESHLDSRRLKRGAIQVLPPRDTGQINIGARLPGDFGRRSDRLPSAPISEARRIFFPPRPDFSRK